MFGWLQRLGDVPQPEMDRVFNQGIGFVMVVSPYFAESIRKQNVAIDQLTIHADRGTSMASKPVALLLADLGVTKSHSRPHCSNDNPYSEAQFKTLKYRPEFPDRFGSIEDGRAFCRRFFQWYNHEHRHSGLGFHTNHSGDN